MHHKLFEDANVLKQICESIIIPNLQVGSGWASSSSSSSEEAWVQPTTLMLC